MRNFRSILSVLLTGALISLSSSNTLAQSLSKLEKAAEKDFVKEKFADALAGYQEVLKLDSKNKIALYRAEICSLLTYYPTKPLDDLRKYAKSGGKGDKFYNYWLGRINLKKHNFEEASTYLSKFLRIKRYKSPEIVEETKFFLEVANKADVFYKASSGESRYVSVHLDDHINTPMDELSPTVCADNNLIFLSSRESSEINHKKETFKVYHAVKNEDEWGVANVEEAFGIFDFENESLSVYDNGNKIAFADVTNTGALKMSEKNGNQWSDAQVLDQKLGNLGIVSRYCLSNDGQRMIFSSAKFNKRGDLDLYSISKNEKGEWGEPMSLGNMINSESDEYSPYLTEDGKKLYFSSNGHETVGGYDVFYADLSSDGNRWLPPVQMEYPINTIDDDIHFVIDKGRGAYVASDRYGTNGGFDIFYIDIEKTKIPEIIELAANEPVQEETKVDEVNDVNLDLYGDKSLHEVAKKEINVERRTSGSLSTVGERMKNVYFNYNKYNLDGEAQSYLDQVVALLKQNPRAKLQLSSHTDNIGSKTINDQISQQRANSVIAYLQSRGVSNDFVTKIYGAEMPLASNDDELEGRQLNRRVEMVLLK